MKFISLKMILMFIIFLNINLKAQVKIEYITGQKSSYKLQDTIKFNVLVKTDPQTCLDGMKFTKLFQSGIATNKIVWKEVRKGLWKCEVLCKILGNEKNLGTLTVIRKTDKENIFFQEKFFIEGN